MLFGQLVQSIDAGIAALQALLEFGARPHVLIVGPVEFDARLGPPFLKVEAVGRVFFFARQGLVGSRHHLVREVTHATSLIQVCCMSAGFY